MSFESLTPRLASTRRGVQHPKVKARRLLCSLLRRLRRAGVNVPRVQLRVGPKADFPRERDMAHVAQDRRGGTITLTVAPRFLVQSSAIQRGVLTHELGHCIGFAQGDYAHSERDADRYAEAAFRTRIFYTRDLGVQTTSASGVRPRPAHLPR